MKRRLRDRVLPDTVLGRTALVLVAALALSAMVALVLGTIQRQEILEAMGGRNAAERVAGFVSMAEQTPPNQRREMLRRLDSPNFRVGWGLLPAVADRERSSRDDFIRDILEEGLKDHEVRVSSRPGHFGGPATGLMGPGHHGMERQAREDRHGDEDQPPVLLIRIAVKLNDGSWLNALTPFERSDGFWRPRFLLPLALALVLVMAAALMAVARATRPFGSFAAAAERLGVDVGAPPMEETGPREVRRAAQAFNIMQGRIKRFVQDRTQMLAAISHDLKTPITRLRLRAEFVDDDEQRAKMLADLDDMEAMICATLAFARDDTASEHRVKLDLATLVQGMVEDWDDLGAKTSYDGPDHLVTQARPNALKRALGNLVDNAIKYGGGAHVALAASESELRITIDDTGPGIPDGDFERVFAPFVRLEASRSRDTGGTGLGLAVARAAIRAHGGDILLANRPEGGLRVTVVLPHSAPAA
jgi:signal transduction histidine kinase